MENTTVGGRDNGGRGRAVSGIGERGNGRARGVVGRGAGLGVHRQSIQRERGRGRGRSHGSELPQNPSVKQKIALLEAELKRPTYRKLYERQGTSFKGTVMCRHGENCWNKGYDRDFHCMFGHYVDEVRKAQERYINDIKTRIKNLKALSAAKEAAASASAAADSGAAESAVTVMCWRTTRCRCNKPQGRCLCRRGKYKAKVAVGEMKLIRCFYCRKVLKDDECDC